MGLSDGPNDPDKKGRLVADSVKLIDDQVAAKKGISGLGYKAAYAALNGISPSYIAGAIERLLPEAMAALDPLWSEGIQTGDPVGYLIQNGSRTADALLGITDARIEKTNNGIVRGTYKKLRSSAKSEVEEGIPGLAGIIDNYTKG